MSIINFIILYLLCISINYSYTCTSDDIRGIIINSCDNVKKLSFELLKHQTPFDWTTCCDPDKIEMCSRYFCH